MSYYNDDPIYESKSRNSIISSVLALVLLIAGGGFFIKSTLAANIALNSGGTVEFGQAVSQERFIFPPLPLQIFLLVVTA